jgi:hypothetical protein
MLISRIVQNLRKINADNFRRLNNLLTLTPYNANHFRQYLQHGYTHIVETAFKINHWRAESSPYNCCYWQTPFDMISQKSHAKACGFAVILFQQPKA